MQIKINKNYHLSRVDRFLREHYSIPQSLVAKIVREKKVKVNKKKVEIYTILQEGDIVLLYYFLEEKGGNLPQIAENKINDFKKWIIYEDNDLLVINKPNGYSSQSGTKSGIAIDELAKAYFSEARITHRLDRETSGVMTIAKNKFTARKITTMFASGEVEKKYYAVVNNYNNEEGVVQTDIQKNINEHKLFITQGNSCITHYKVVKKIGKYFLVEVIPKTGKMHQIRVHLSSIGMPIIGDKKYGGIPYTRMLLHAFSINFDGKYFTVPLPLAFTGK